MPILKPGQKLHLHTTSISYTFFLKFILLLQLCNVTQRTILFLPSYSCVISTRDLVQAFEVKKKEKYEGQQQYSSYSHDGRLTFLMTRGSMEPVCTFSPVTTSTVQVPCHLTCLLRLFFKTVGIEHSLQSQMNLTFP